MPITYDPIATTTLSSNAATIGFTGIPGTYTDLRLVLYGTTTGGNSFLILTTNSGVDFYREGFGQSANTIFATWTSNASAGTIGVGSYNQGGGDPVYCVADMFNYAASSVKKAGIVRVPSITSGGAIVSTTNVVSTSSTNALTSLGFALGANNFQSGTIATLYGITRA